MTPRILFACALSFALAASASPAEKAAATPSRPSVVASVEGVTIDASELEAAGGARVFTEAAPRRDHHQEAAREGGQGTRHQRRRADPHRGGRQGGAGHAGRGQGLLRREQGPLRPDAGSRRPAEDRDRAAPAADRRPAHGIRGHAAEGGLGEGDARAAAREDGIARRPDQGPRIRAHHDRGVRRLPVPLLHAGPRLAQAGGGEVRRQDPHRLP